MMDIGDLDDDDDDDNADVDLLSVVVDGDRRR